MYAAEAILDYLIPPTEVYAAEAILNYTAPAEVYAAEAILDYAIAENAPCEAYAAEAILDYVAPAEVYAAEAVLDYEVPPCEVYAAEAILNYISPAEVYATEAILDYIAPAEVYATEAILDYEIPPAEVYAAEVILDYTPAALNPCEVYATEVILDYEILATGGGSSKPFRWTYIPSRKTPDELRDRRRPKTIKQVSVEDWVAPSDSARATIMGFADPETVYLTDSARTDTRATTIETLFVVDSALSHRYTTTEDGIRMMESVSIFDIEPERHDTARGRALEMVETMRVFAKAKTPSPLRKRLIRQTDPSLTRKVENDYAKELDALFRAFKTKAAQILGRRELSDDWDEVDAPDLMEKFNREIEVTITIPGRGVVKKFTTRAYTAGGLRSSQFLSSLGIKAVFSILPADKGAIDILLDTRPKRPQRHHGRNEQADNGGDNGRDAQRGLDGRGCARDRRPHRLDRQDTGRDACAYGDDEGVRRRVASPVRQARDNRGGLAGRSRRTYVRRVHEHGRPAVRD